MWAALILAATPVLHVSANARLGGDGSAERPFTRVVDAVSKAPDGSTIAVETGLYEGQLELARPIRIEGHGQVVLAAPSGADIEIRIRADVSIDGVSIQGGRVGVQVDQGKAQLAHVKLRGQPDVAMVCGAGAQCALVDVEMQSSFPQAVGLRGPGTIDVANARFTGPFRRAVELKAGTLTGDGLEIDGAVTGLHAIGANVELRNARFDDLRGSCTFAAKGTLTLREPVFSGCDVAMELRDDAKATLIGAVAAGCERAVVASIQSHVTVRDLVAVGPSRDAVLMLVDGDVNLEDVRLRLPGPTGVMMRGGTLRFRNLVVDGARVDHDDFGNAIFLYNTSVDGEGLLARRCEGPA